MPYRNIRLSREAIRPANRSARVHSKDQLQKAVRLMRKQGIVTPLIVDEDHGCCQTKSNSSLPGQRRCPLCRAETAPLDESSGSLAFEIVPFGEAAILVEVVEDGGMDGNELLQTSHSPKALHGSFSSSEWKV